METTENMTTVRAQDIPTEEIVLVRNAIWDLVDDNKVDRESPLVEAIHFILDTLKAGRDITIMAEPNPNDYVLLGEALTRAEAFGNRYGAGPQ